MWRDFKVPNWSKFVVLWSLRPGSGKPDPAIPGSQAHHLTQKCLSHLYFECLKMKYCNPSNIRKMMEDEQWWLTGGFGATTFLEKPMLLTSPVSKLRPPTFGSYVWSHLQPLGTSSSCSQARTWVHALETVRNFVGTCDYHGKTLPSGSCPRESFNFRASSTFCAGTDPSSM